MRYTWELRDEIEHVNNALQPYGDAATVDAYPGVQAMRRILQAQRDQLLADLAKLEAGELLIVLDGGAVHNHSADVDTLSAALAAFQHSVSAVGQALGGDRITDRGRLADDLLSRTAMRLTGVGAGSFVAILEGPLPEPEQLRLTAALDDDERPLFHLAVERVLDILTASQSAEYERAILDAMADLGTRVTAHVEALAKVVARNDAPTEFVWRAPDAAERHVRLAQAPAERLREVVQGIETGTASLEVAGTLVGAHVRRRTFSIIAEDGREFSGRVAMDIAERMVEDYFNKPCRATITATTTKNVATGHSVTRYTLERFSGPLGA